MSGTVETGDMEGVTTYQFQIEKGKWETWKDTVPRSKSLDERLIELVEADTEGRVLPSTTVFVVVRTTYDDENREETFVEAACKTEAEAEKYVDENFMSDEISDIVELGVGDGDE